MICNPPIWDSALWLIILSIDYALIIVVLRRSAGVMFERFQLDFWVKTASLQTARVGLVFGYTKEAQGKGQISEVKKFVCPGSNDHGVSRNHRLSHLIGIHYLRMMKNETQMVY